MLPIKWLVFSSLAIIGQKDLELPNLFLQPRKMPAKRALPRRWHTFCKQNTLFMIREKSNIIMFDPFWTNLIPVCISPVILGLMPFSYAIFWWFGCSTQWLHIFFYLTHINIHRIRAIISCVWKLLLGMLSQKCTFVRDKVSISKWVSTKYINTKSHLVNEL